MQLKEQSTGPCFLLGLLRRNLDRNTSQGEELHVVDAALPVHTAAAAPAESRRNVPPPRLELRSKAFPALTAEQLSKGGLPPPTYYNSRPTSPLLLLLRHPVPSSLAVSLRSIACSHRKLSLPGLSIGPKISGSQAGPLVDLCRCFSAGQPVCWGFGPGI